MSRSILAGLIGDGIQASRSPQIHEQEAAELGLRLIYKLLDTRGCGEGALARFLDAVELIGFSGVNITHPFKQTVIPLIHELSDEAAAIGAVNTVVFSAGRRTGYNTDSPGFAENLRRGLPGATLNHVLLVGAGGAGAAVGYAVLRMGADRLSIYDVDSARADQLAKRFSELFGSGRAVSSARLESVIGSVDGLIHATPTGMVGHPGLPVPAHLLRPAMWVTDVVYTPLETELLQTARSMGCATLDGGGMTVFQAAECFRLFTGVKPDRERMRRNFPTG